MKDSAVGEGPKTAELKDDRIIVRVPSVLIPGDENEDIFARVASTNYYTAQSRQSTNCCTCDKE